MLLAILSGILTFRKYGELWLSYRTTEELLEHERFLFLTSAGKYREKEPFPTFVQTVESIISAEHSKFRTLVEESQRPTTGEAAQQ